MSSLQMPFPSASDSPPDLSIFLTCRAAGCLGPHCIRSDSGRCRTTTSSHAEAGIGDDVAIT
eukprot:25083-Eustigmatos_ZCMA.PRE.1